MGPFLLAGLSIEWRSGLCQPLR